MKELYIVFECDNHRAYQKYCIKLITSSKKVANTLYNKARKHYDTDDNYYLNIASYTPVLIPECDNNVLRDLVVFKTTESHAF
jgi:hypothetical protein